MNEEASIECECDGPSLRDSYRQNKQPGSTGCTKQTEGSVVSILLEDLNRETSSLNKDVTRLHDRLSPVMNEFPKEELNSSLTNSDSPVGRELVDRIAEVREARREIDYIISTLEI